MDKANLSYVIGVAIGDGNLSNPNGRAIRLRVTCDAKYENLIEKITLSIKDLFPENKVSATKRKDNCVDISCYSNKWGAILSWKVGLGSKEKQKVSVPKWIQNNRKYTIKCLEGLFETDGSIYIDRGYKMANFTTIIPTLANDVMEMISSLGFNPNMQRIKSKNKKIKYTIRISRRAEEFINLIGIDKS